MCVPTYLCGVSVNYILAPCLATLVLKPACFFYLFNTNPSIIATFADVVCSLYSYAAETDSFTCVQVRL